MLKIYLHWGIRGQEFNLKILIAILFFVILIIYFIVTLGGEVISIRDIFIE